MKLYVKPLAFATAFLALPLFVLGQNSGMQNGQNSNGMNNSQNRGAQHAARREARRMVPANAELLGNLNAKAMHNGSLFSAKLSKTATLEDGTKLPDGTILMGRVEGDDMQVQGMSKLALRFTQAQLKDGKTVPIRATIVGIAPPETTNSEGYPVTEGNQVSNNWNDGTLQVNQLGVMRGVDLHSSIASKNSGVFVSTTKDNFKLNRGSEIELAIGQRMNRRNAAASMASPGV